MRILQLCKKYPYPVKDGESYAIVTLAASLQAQGCVLDMLAMNTLKHYANHTTKPEKLHFYENINVVSVDTSVKPWSAFINLFSSDSYHIIRFVSNEYSDKLKSLLQSNTYDIIQLETLYLAPYIDIIRAYSNAKIVMRSHNVEYEIWSRIVDNTTNPVKKWYLSYLTKKLKRFEIAQLAKYDLLAAITPKDLQNFKSLDYSNKSVCAPIGIQAEHYDPNYATLNDQHLAFIGSLDWMPNVEGLKWFLQNVWSRVREQFPSLEFHIAGRNPVSEIKNWKQDGVVVHGEVEDAKAFINTYPIQIVPLLSGSGMRVKILESMALGRVVVTTRVGVEGIYATDRKDILIADTPQEMTEAIIYALENTARREQIGKAARAFVVNEFDDVRISRRLVQVYKSILV